MVEKQTVKRRKECAKCGGCCTDTFVPVTDADVRVLMKRTGRPAPDIVHLCHPRDADCDDDFDGWVKLGRGKRALSLKQKNKRCIFLSDENTCVVYDARPMTCRTFPWMVYLDEDGDVEEMFLNDEIGCGLGHGPHIPRKELLANVRKEDSRDDAYYRKVRKWNGNGHGGAVDDFFRFLGL